MSVYIGRNKVAVNSENKILAKKILNNTIEEFDNNEWGLTSLRPYLFAQNRALKSVDLTGITDIPERAFYNAENVEKIIVDKNTTRIGTYGLSGVGNVFRKTDFDVEFNSVSLETYAFTFSSITSLKGQMTKFGTYATHNLEQLKNVDITINGILDGNNFSSSKNVQSFKLNPESNITKLGGYNFRGFGHNRTNPEKNIFEFDLRKSTFTSVAGDVFNGLNALEKNKYFRIFMPETLTSSMGSNFCRFSEYFNVYFSTSTPSTLNSNAFSNGNNNKIFVPYNSINAYKTATNWVKHADYIYGWAEENSFKQGTMLPKYSAEGYELTWYSDEDMTTQVTSVADASKIYYCTIGDTKVEELITVSSIATADSNVSIVDNNGMQYEKGYYIPVGTQLTITTSPTISGYVPHNQTLNGADFTSPYIYTTVSGTNIDIVSIYWNGVDTPVNLDFAQNSWAMIKDVIQQGKAGEYWSVGDVKEIEVDGLTYGVRLSDLQQGRYQYADGSRTTNAVLEFVEMWSNDYKVNATATNKGGWEESELRITLNTEILAKLPADLQGLLEEVVVASANGGSTNYTGITESNNKLFIPCASEVALSTSYGKPEEGTVWDYYIGANNEKRKKYRLGIGGYWWLRSPYTSDTSSFTAIHGAGNGDRAAAQNSMGVVPCFAW